MFSVISGLVASHSKLLFPQSFLNLSQSTVFFYIIYFFDLVILMVKLHN